MGKALRIAREEQGLTQRRLAIRADTSQDAISRIERGVQQPTIRRFAELMLVLGRSVTLDIEYLGGGLSPEELADTLDQTPAERLREAASLNRIASQLAVAGKKERQGRRRS